MKADAIYTCRGCDLMRDESKAFCPTCSEVTDSNLVEYDADNIPHLRRYHADPAYRAQIEQDRQSHHDRANALIDAGMASYRSKNSRIVQVMHDTGMDRLQATRHIEQRDMLRVKRGRAA